MHGLLTVKTLTSGVLNEICIHTTSLPCVSIGGSVILLYLMCRTTSTRLYVYVGDDVTCASRSDITLTHLRLCSKFLTYTVRTVCTTLQSTFGTMEQSQEIVVEGYREKAIRKFKNEPLVPLGALATTGALTMAMIKMRKGQSNSFNKWLRVRVIAQGLTIVAICAGTFTFSTYRPPKHDEPTISAINKVQQDRVEFAERMRAAEEAEAVESALRPSTAPIPKTVLKKKTYADKKTSAEAVDGPTATSTESATAGGDASTSGWWGWGSGSGSGKEKA